MLAQSSSSSSAARGPSCDTCRARKVKCAFTPISDPQQAMRSSCDQCIRHDIACTWNYKLTRKSRLTGLRARQGLERQSHPVAQPASPAATNPHPGTSERHQADDSLFAGTISHPLLIRSFQVYFDYLYPTLPCIHRPTAMELVGQAGEAGDEWIAVQLLLAAATFVQVPWAFIDDTACGMSKQDVKMIATRCMKAGKAIIMEDYEEPTLMRCACLSCSAQQQYSRQNRHRPLHGNDRRP